MQSNRVTGDALLATRLPATLPGSTCSGENASQATPHWPAAQYRGEVVKGDGLLVTRLSSQLQMPHRRCPLASCSVEANRVTGAALLATKFNMVAKRLTGDAPLASCSVEAKLVTGDALLATRLNM